MIAKWKRIKIPFKRKIYPPFGGFGPLWHIWSNKAKHNRKWRRRLLYLTDKGLWQLHQR